MMSFFLYSKPNVGVSRVDVVEKYILYISMILVTALKF